MSASRHTIDPGRRRPLALAMALESAALATMSGLHLSGALSGGPQPFNPRAAGIAEAVICLALAGGAIALARRSPDSWRVAAGAVCVAILGFVVGLYFSLNGGHPVDLAFHATMLPLLAITLAALLLAGSRTTRSSIGSSFTP